jgi:hypothetical protein
MKMNTPIPIEHLKTIWKSFSEMNAQIKGLNEKILSLKDYINTTISGIDLSHLLTKDQVFNDGDLEKNIEIGKNSSPESFNTENSNVYIGGDLKGSVNVFYTNNTVLGLGSYSKRNENVVVGTNAYSVGGQSVSIGNASHTNNDFSVAVGDHSNVTNKGVALGYATVATGIIETL